MRLSRTVLARAAALGPRPRPPPLRSPGRRALSESSPAAAASAAAASATPTTPTSSTNPAMAFPCLDRLDERSAMLSQGPAAARPGAGPEPDYTSGKHKRFVDEQPHLLDWGGILPSQTIAYESWGTLNRDRSNAILLHAGLSASSHAHSTAENPQPGWWERFIGPGRPLDTDRWFVVCSNHIGGCYGSTGPSSADPADGRPYATRFPIVTVDDMVRAQFRLLDHLGIERVHASVGASLGGMQSLAAAVMFPDRVGRVVSISGCGRSHPYSIAMRHAQRQVLMMDPNWARGFYYGSAVPPHAGMKLAREIATVAYRGGPEWEHRFGRRRADPDRPPALCPDFLIETYLDHAGEKWCLEYDPNSFLYVSKAVDLFDVGAANRAHISALRKRNGPKLAEFVRRQQQQQQQPQPHVAADADPGPLCNFALSPSPSPSASTADPAASATAPAAPSEPTAAEADPLADLAAGLAPLRSTPALVLGVKTDVLVPAWQQAEVAAALRAAGNGAVEHVELSEAQSLFGHDTFLLDLENVGGAVGRFLARERP